MKYQFSIRTGKKNDKNSAASKAVLDCSTLLTQLGYKDYSLVFSEDQNKLFYYVNIFLALVKFYFSVDKDAYVCIQYPMLNNVFKYFIKAVHQKNVQVFCVIHDIESLRLGGTDKEAVHREVVNLNYYDCLIVHNETMLQWLAEKGITKKMVPLILFDYLTDKSAPKVGSGKFSHTVCFAGNLTKSSFIYHLGRINNWNFNVYGPNFQRLKITSRNVKWGGEFSPEQIVLELKSDFGLIWDGDSIDECDAILGSYLRYNNPHKFSLYMAAGIPVIAPANAAIGVLIKEHNVGILVESLYDLNHLQIDQKEYNILRQNCRVINAKITTGDFFLNALSQVEKELAH